MVTIFAGRDASGAIRFLDQVSSGLGCGCSCMVCGAALVAKKGQINDWHFAHESGQTNPECAVGAANLLRKMAAQRLSETGRFPNISPFRTTARSGRFEVAAQWAAPILGVEWLDGHRAEEPLAILELPRDHHANVYLCIEGETPPALDPMQGALGFHLPMPPATAFRSHEDLRRFIDSHLTGQWLHLPDLEGQLAEAQREAEAQALAERERIERYQAGLRQAAGQRWAKIRRAAQQIAPSAHFLLDEQSPMPWAPPAQEARDKPQSPSPEIAEDFPWAEDHKPLSSFFCLHFNDGSQWLLYETNAHGYLLRPWPQAEEGWDEALPPSIGVADESLVAYRVPSYYDFLMASRAFLAGMRNTSSAFEVPACFGN